MTSLGGPARTGGQALVFRSHALGHACRDLKGRAQVPGPGAPRKPERL